jgi:hypothetical protein
MNDNMTPAREVALAADMARWAASRASEPAFAPMCHAAAAMAQRVRAAHRPRPA